MADIDPKAEVTFPGTASSVETVDGGAIGDKKFVAPKVSLSKKKAAEPEPKFHMANEHPKYSVMVAHAVSQLKGRKGSSRQAILQYVTSHYNVGTDVNRINAHVKVALKSGVKSGLLEQVTGRGASGSFCLGQQQKSSKKSANPRATVVKKPTGSAKKTTMKKSKKSVGRPVGRPKTLANKKTPAKKAKSPSMKANSPTKKPKSGPKKVKTAASKAFKPKSSAKNKQKSAKKTVKK